MEAVAFFAVAAFFGAFGLDAFFAAAGFFVAVDFGFFVVVVLLVFGFVAFFVAVFFAPVDFAAPVFFALVCVVFFVFVVDLVVADFDLVDLAVFAFLGLAALVVAVVVVDDVEADAPAGVDVVAELFVLVAVAAFFAGLDPADFDRERFFVAEPVDVDEVDFFGLLVFFFLATFVAFSFNLNEPLAPLPLVCLKDLAFTPFRRADLRC